MPQSVSHKVARNSLFSGLRHLVVAGSMFLVAPYAIYRLGTDRFAIWALGNALAAYTQLGDFGISRALVKYIAEFKARDDEQAANCVASTALMMYLLSGGLICSLLLTVRDIMIVHLFHIPPALQHEARLVFTGVVLIAAAKLVLSVFRSLLEGIQRMDVTNSLTSLTSVLSAVGVFLALELGYGLAGLVVKNALLAAIMASSYWLMVRRLWPSFRLDPRGFRLNWVRRILNFSMPVQVVNVVAFLIEPVNKTVLSSLLPLNFVAYYEVALRIVGQGVGLFQSLALTIYPAAAEVQVKSGREAVKWVYVQSTRYMTLLVLPVFTILIVLAPGLIHTWLGPNYVAAGFTLQLLTLGWLIALPSAPAYLIAQAMGRPRLSMVASIVTATSSIALGLVLLLVRGYYGFVLGNALASILGAICMFFLFHRALDLSWRPLRRAMFNRALIINGLLGLGTYWVIAQIHKPELWTLALVAFGYLLTYSVLLLLGGFIDSYDWQMLQNLLPKQLSTWLDRGGRTVFVRSGDSDEIIVPPDDFS